MAQKELYSQVISITEDYLGPAAERFVQRLINFHFNKPPIDLNRGDIPKLTEWIKVSLGLLTDDKKLVDECEQKLLKLA